MSKYGFIYLWYDSFRKMYYIGCHWGHIWDGYICSSNRMRDAYRRRPQDFKRRILKTDIPDKKSMLEEEHRWLSMIDQDQLGQKYYNLSQRHFGHWSSTEHKNEILEKLSKAAKGRTYNLSDEEKIERGKRISEGKKQKRLEKEALGLPIRDPNAIVVRGRKQSPEEKAKRSEALKKAWAEGRNTGTTGTKCNWSNERRENHKNGVQGCHVNRDSKPYSEANKKAWAEGKFSHRRPNNMRDFIWVNRKDDGINTRIPKSKFDETLYNLGRSNKNNMTFD